MMGTPAAMHAAIIVANLRSLSAHSLAISSAPLLPPLLTVSTVMGIGRTLRASDDCCCCWAAGAGGVARAAAKSGAAPARCSCQVPLAAALQVRAEIDCGVIAWSVAAVAAAATAAAAVAAPATGVHACGHRCGR